MKKKEQKNITTAAVIGTVLEKDKIEKIYLAVFRGILIFLATYGSVGTYLSAFGIPYNKGKTIIVIALSCLYMGAIYYNKWTENIGYIMLLGGFAMAALQMRRYLESGFAAVLNETTDVLSQLYDLPAMRLFQESLDDRYTAITVCVIFLGIFTGILFNISIARYMSLTATVAIMFPSVGTALFFGRNIEKKYIFMIAIAIMITAVLRRGENYRIRKKNFRIFKKKRDNTIEVEKKAGSIFIQTGIWLGGLMFVFFCTVQLIYPQENFKTPASWKNFKESSNDSIRTILTVGFPSFLIGQYGGGGISGGNLNGVASVTPDYQTDLKVQFVPYTKETMYLRAFIGTDYSGKRWSAEPKKNPFTDLSAKAIHNRESSILEKAYKERQNKDQIKTKMRIQNIDANQSYGYFPYYSVINEEVAFHYGTIEDRIEGSLKANTSYDFTYYPYLEGVTVKEEDKAIEERYALYATETYLQIPDKNKMVLTQICDSIGRNGTQQEKIQRVTSYLEAECSYSKRPGATPRGEDFVNYFLEKKKRGFCMHFASAGTLLLREMGIPARYVEGYVMPYSDVTDAEILEDEDYDAWFRGSNPLGKTAVVEVEVDDSMAHAWVEVYEKGFGWRVVDVTPAYYGEVEEEDFWRDFRRGLQSDRDEEDNQMQATGISSSIKTTGTAVLTFLAVCLLVKLFYGNLWRRIKRRYYYAKRKKAKQYAVMAEYEYTNLCGMLAYLSERKELLNKEPKEICVFLQKQSQSMGIEESMKWNEIAAFLEKAFYSPYEITKREYESYHEELIKFIKQYRRKQKWKKQIGAVFRGYI